jgi:hypothetical protein
MENFIWKSVDGGYNPFKDKRYKVCSVHVINNKVIFYAGGKENRKLDYVPSGTASARINLYELIFRTNFLKCAIGKGKYLEYLACRERGAEICDTENCGFIEKVHYKEKEDRDINTDCYKKDPVSCGFLQNDGGVMVDTDYHKQQVALLGHDLNRVKEYLAELV